MPKSRYVFICLIWLSHYPLGTSYASSPVRAPVAEPDQKVSAHTQPLPKTIPAEAAMLPEQLEDAMGVQGQDLGQNPQPPDEKKSPSAHNNAEDTSKASEMAPHDVATPEPRGPIQAVIHYKAEESMFFDIKNKTVHLYGGAFVEYDNIKLESEEVSLDWPKNTITAFSKKNESGEIQQKVVVTRDGIEYIAEDVCYNLDSHRGIASNLFTKQDDGLLRTNKVKQSNRDTFYADTCCYTTCNLTKPCYHIKAHELKMTQGDKAVSGPFQFYFDNVPTPLGFVTGLFYFSRKSGILFPKYGGESSKGFCLKEGGYYFQFNDYIDLALKGEIYSKGPIGFTAESQYKKRYQYNGNFFYRRNTYISTLASNDSFEEGWKFKWEHTTENSRTSSLNAFVNLQSSSFKTFNRFSRTESLQGVAESSIRYMNKLVGLPYTLNANLGYSQPLRSSRTRQPATATIPSITLSTGSIYPLRKKGKVGDNWYSNIYFQHTVKANNQLSGAINNDIVDFSLKNWTTLFKNSKYDAGHEASLQTNIKLLSYLNLKPALTYREKWYWEKSNHKTQKSAKSSERFCDFSGELTTTLYGTYQFSPHATIQTVRHELTPLLSFTYTPDFSDPKYGYWQAISPEIKKNRFEGAVYDAPTAYTKAVMHIALNNRLNMKVKSTEKYGKSTKKIPILESFNWSTKYDFLKDEFALEDIELRTSTNLFKNLFDIEFNATFDPYLYEARSQTRINEFAWQHGQGLGRLKNTSLTIHTELSPDDKEDTWEQDEDFDEEEEDEPRHVQERPEQYVDFKVPWSLSLDYEWRYDGDRPKEYRIIQELSFSTRVKLTRNWEVNLSSAYDFTEKKLTDSSTSIEIYRDMHCWEMNFKWNPLGDNRSYEFSIGIKSPLLQALKYERSRSYNNY